MHPPRQPLTGNSHAHLLAPLVTFAEWLGYAVVFQSIPGATDGWCDPRARRIVIDADMPANAQARTLVHEITHALGVDYATYSRAQAEVIVDTAIFCPAETETRVGGWPERA